jgi:hypothetical protein
MLELYWAEACELEPPSEGVGYGDLEASMAISSLSRMWWFICVYGAQSERVDVTTQSRISLVRPSWISYTHAGMHVGWDMGRLVGDGVSRLVGVVRVTAADVEACSVVDVVRDGVDATTAYGLQSRYSKSSNAGQ